MQLMTYKNTFANETTTTKVLVVSEVVGHQLVTKWNRQLATHCRNMFRYSVIDIVPFMGHVKDYDSWLSLDIFKSKSGLAFRG
jgi:extradiol dioxygenase family protein